MPDRDALQAKALRYAARDLSPADAAAFEARLAADPAACDALAEAVRLSAAALGQEPPAPDPSFRRAIAERLRPLPAWWGGWVRRRAYRGHPLAWAAGGVVAAAGLVVVSRELGSAPEAPPAPAPAAEVAAVEPPAALDPHPDPDPDPMLRTAEIWAELSTPGHVEKAHEDEQQRRRRLRDWHLPPAARTPAMFAADGPE